jgi:hypothetical protein
MKMMRMVNGDEVLGNGADCTSPTMSTCGKDGQSFIGGQLANLSDWLHESKTNNTFYTLLLLAAPITQVFPCVACKNINNPTTLIPVFLQKTSNTTWEMFEEDFSKIGPKLDWNGDEGLRDLWRRYYRYPHAEFIQRALAVRMQQDPSDRAMHHRALAETLDKQFARCLEKSPKTNNNKHKSLSAATPSSTSLIRFVSRNPASFDADASGMRSNDLQSYLSMRGTDLQAALDKHQDNVLHLLWMGTTAGQNIISKKMLTKVCKANMTTMTQINTLIARAGSKELFTQRSKELGSIAKHTAMELYVAKVAEQNAMEQEPPSKIDAPVVSDVLIVDQEPTVTDLQHYNNFWQLYLPNRCHILSMEPDGNCFFSCISDQLNHDDGAGHDFTCHQPTNHIRRYSNKFKNFLLLGNDHKDITDLDNYIHNMGQNGTWGGHPEVYASAWFYDVDITIYSPEYTNTGGVLVFKAGGPNSTCNTPNAMWNILNHGNNLLTASNHPRILLAHPRTSWMWILTKPICRMHWTTTKTILPSLPSCHIITATPFLPTTLNQFGQPPA